MNEGKEQKTIYAQRIWYFVNNITFLNIDDAVCIIPKYICSPVTWNANLALIISNGYVIATAVTPEAEPAKNLSTWR